jgi:nickel/cobalt transporter (NicO) family protein
MLDAFIGQSLLAMKAVLARSCPVTGNYPRRMRNALAYTDCRQLACSGPAMTFVMGLGTAITVGAIATLAVGAKAIAKPMAQRPSGYGTILMRRAELAAAGCVLAFGVLLLTGYMASERMGLF